MASFLFIFKIIEPLMTKVTGILAFMNKNLNIFTFFVKNISKK